NPLNTVGYKELFEFFDGTISRRVAIEKIKQHTRNFAKRQLTWWRRDQEINWIEMDGLPDPLLLIKNIIESRNMQ
ncbi:MAG: tRNA (adenosine(37)-N6)-dimethylallyltransferase MiaA, partial [Crocinitomicaceae bacterium]|nr:tRNA (adenosine(37)-N6)-dimethylallyltransferase MiaA [Crocinitomicaceae bacterium]